MVDNGTESEHQSTRIAAIITQVIGPALAIAVVGSIAFFLIDISYTGPLVGRCKWIFSLFCVAAVLISRISIVDGYQHAAGYGLLLAFATLLVSARFMQGNIIWLALILGFVWWCAGRLTWDCTFIDATRDATGQGMIDLAIDRATSYRKEKAELSSPPSSNIENVVGMAKRESTWQHFKRIFFKRRQPNTPGLWAFYFLIGGLPFFGIGQMFIPMRDAARHHSVSMQVLVYFLGVLGLLMISSVTGLHRYLQRNDSALPTRIAVRWLITGTILALLIAIVSWLMPRPSPQYSIAGLIPRFTSPNLNASINSMGQDGQKQSDQNSNLNSGPQSQNRNAGEKESKQGNSGNQKTDDQGNPVDKQGAKQEGGQSEGKAEGGGKKSEGSQSSSGKQDGESSSQESKGDSDKSGKPGSEKEESDSSSSDGKKSDEQSKESGGEKSESGDKGQKNEGRKADDRVRNKQESKQQDSQQQSGEQQQGNQNSGEQEKNDDGGNEQDEEKNDQQGKGNSAGQSQSSPPPRASNSFTSKPGQLVKLLFLTIAAFVIAWFALKNRSRLLPWFHSFLQELLGFWNRLFNRKPGVAATAKTIAETESREIPGALPGFQQFRNPFADGTAKTWPPEKVVRYTYEAFEAWSRDHQCSREPEQTVFEFAHSTGKQYKFLASDVLQLATLYSQLAYAGATVSQSAAMTLSGLWDKLTSLYKSRI